MKTFFLITVLLFLNPLIGYCDESSWSDVAGSINCTSDKDCKASIKDGEEFKILTNGYLEGLEKSVNQIQGDLINDSDIVGLRKKILENPVVIEALILKAKREIEKEKESK